MARVVFSVDGVAVATDTISPFSAVWNSFLWANGPHTVSARAFDTAGNNSSDQVGLFVLNSVDVTSPSVSITFPGQGDILTGLVIATAAASDDVAVSSVAFFVDGTLRFVSLSSPYEFPWDTTADADGLHTLLARAFDYFGHSADSSISVTVQNTVQGAGAGNETAFIFPNPGKAGQNVILSVTTDPAASIDVTVYTLGGRRVDGWTVTGNPVPAQNGKLNYETPWNTTGIAAGAYVVLWRITTNSGETRILRKIALR